MTMPDAPSSGGALGNGEASTVAVSIKVHNRQPNVFAQEALGTGLPPAVVVSGTNTASTPESSVTPSSGLGSRATTHSPFNTPTDPAAPAATGSLTHRKRGHKGFDTKEQYIASLPSDSAELHFILQENLHRAEERLQYWEAVVRSLEENVRTSGDVKFKASQTWKLIPSEGKALIISLSQAKKSVKRNKRLVEERSQACDMVNPVSATYDFRNYDLNTTFSVTAQPASDPRPKTIIKKPSTTSNVPNVKNGEGKKTELPRPELFQLETHPEQSQLEFLQLYDISLITERRNVFTPYVHNEVPVHQVMPSQQAQHFHESSMDYRQMQSPPPVLRRTLAHPHQTMGLNREHRYHPY